MNIQQFLAENQRFTPVHILGPEDCALCEIEGLTVHVMMIDGKADVMEIGETD